MAAYEVLLLNTAIPQIQAAQSGDTYVVPRDIAFSAALTLSAGTANGVPYLNASKVLTTGSALTFDGTNLGIGTPSPAAKLEVSSGNIFLTQDYEVQWKAGSVTRAAIRGTSGDGLNFYVRTGGVVTQAMTLDADGDLGIGITNPVAKLDLAAGAGAAVIAIRVRSVAGNANGFNIVTDSTTDNIYLNNFYNAAMLFGTNNTERARITSGGYFKASNDGNYVGSTAAYHELRQTANNYAVQVRATDTTTYTSNVVFIVGARTTTNSTYNLIAAQNGDGTGVFIVRDSGNAVNTNGSYGTTSDQKLKQDIVDAGSQWADLKAIRFRKYRMKADVAANPDAPALLGVVAQELEQVSPGLVEESPDRDAEGNDLGTTTKSVKTSVLLMKAAVALQEAMARIEQLEAKVASLGA